MRRNSDKKKLLRLVLFIVGVLLIGVIVPRILSTMGSIALYPVHVAQEWWQQTSAAVPALWRDKIAMQEEIDNLNTELAQQGDSSVSISRLQDENRSLRGLLSADATERIAAVVTARPNQLPYDLVQIDQGSSAGVEVGAPVYVGGDNVIGLVSLVYNRSALVTLFTTPGFSTTAYISGSDVLVTLEGLGGGAARVLVPQGLPFKEGALVYLPSIQPGLFGRIIYIENEPTQPQQYGYLSNVVPLQHLRHVSIGQAAKVSTEVESVEGYLKDINDRLMLPDILVPTSTVATSTATGTLPAISLENN